MVLGLDLNFPPSTVDNMDDLVDVSLSIRPPGNSGSSRMQTDAVDDDVVVCSPRSFAEAREKARRKRGVIEVIDDGSDLHRDSSESMSGRNNRHRRGPAKPTIVNSAWCINLEDSEKPKTRNVSEGPGISQCVPPPKAPNFSCPVCMGPFAEETSTKCGHIFCKECIYKAIAAQSKCPTCRRKLKVKDTFRIYLPASD